MDLSHLLLLLFLCTLYCCVDGTKVRSCATNSTYEENENVNVIPCKKLPCKLKRKTTVSIEIRFTPEMDYEDLKTRVYAKIVGIPFPFIGVDGKSACQNVFDGKTGEKVDCPLKKGVEYVYKSSFKVLEIYPRLKLLVHWELRDEDDYAVCFEVPARITG